ncbi:ParA family protein [Acidianus sp. RZ1]|uniref:tyrosine-protein kinase family protein n=1 Tax=Acidianus sp. RZ1 TaxID=1540082 RepID=UPI001491E3E8|nr:ParA family protein [Acidianus sp. RZ1]NON63208.1 ParA family protein [Acidianus sp. RZ1]
MIRITILGIKGGVGKSTFALLLSRELSKYKNVILLDRDLLGYSSRIAGIESDGLLSSIINEEKDTKDYYKEITRDDHKLGILKLIAPIGSWEKNENLLEKDKKVEEKFANEYKRIISSDYDILIVDNPPLITPSYFFIKEELTLFSSVFSTSKIMGIFVSDFSNVSITSTMRYATEALKFTNFRLIPYYFIINMVPPGIDLDLKDLEEKIKKNGISVLTPNKFY